MNEATRQVEEIQLDLETLVTLTERGFIPKVRGILCAARIERAVRGWYNCRTML